jgi:hypothetical protein
VVNGVQKENTFAVEHTFQKNTFQKNTFQKSVAKPPFSKRARKPYEKRKPYEESEPRGFCGLFELVP